MDRRNFLRGAVSTLAIATAAIAMPMVAKSDELWEQIETLKIKGWGVVHVHFKMVEPNE